jgi:HEAT repeat protein
MGSDAVPAISEGLTRKSPETRRQCISLLNQTARLNAKLGDLVAQRLKDDDKTVRLEAARGLLFSVPHRKDVVEVLTEALNDKDLAHRRLASAAVFGISPRPRELLRAYVGLLDDPDTVMAGNAALAVWELTKDPNRVVPTLNRILKDRSGTGNFPAIITLKQMGPAAIGCLPALLNNPATDSASLVAIVKQIGPPALPDLLVVVNANVDSPNRQRAIEALGGAGPEAMPRLLKLIEEPNVGVREAAIRSLGSLGPQAKDALPLLRRIAGEERGPIRAAAVTALGRFGPEAKPAVPLLLEALKDKDVGTYYAAIAALAAVPLDPKAAVPALDAAMKDPMRRGIHFQAAQLRLKLDPDLGPVLPVLGDLLQEVPNQTQIVTLLGQFGPKAKPVLPQLMDLVKDPRASPYSRVPMITAMVQIDPEGNTIAPVLAKLVGDGDRGVRIAAIGAVADVGHECDVSPIVLELRTTDVLARQQIHQALRRLGPKAKGATTALVEVVRGPVGPLSLEAAETLCKVAPEHAELGKRVLLDALGEGTAARLDVARALLAVDGSNDRALKVFEAALKDDNPARRSAALSSLAQSDVSAKALLPHVKPLLADKEPILRGWAARAYVRIGGEPEPAVEVLTAMLADPKVESWHGPVVSFLGEMGPKAKGAVPTLTALLKGTPRLRTDVIAALKKIDPVAARVAEMP